MPLKDATRSASYHLLQLAGNSCNWLFMNLFRRLQAQRGAIGTKRTSQSGYWGENNA